MSLTLWKINEEQARLNYMLEESGGEITPEIEQALTINEGNFLTKCENYIAAIRQYQALDTAAKKEIERIRAVQNAAKKIQSHLKNRIEDAMNLFGKTKVELDVSTISFRKSTEVSIYDPDVVPSQYLKVETCIDKQKIKDDLKMGIDVPGASLKENRNLQIK